MTKREIRTFVAGFFQRPKNKWEAYSRAWDRFNIAASQTILWLSAFLTNNVIWMIALYVCVLWGFGMFYLFFAKGR